MIKRLFDRIEEKIKTQRKKAKEFSKFLSFFYKIVYNNKEKIKIRGGQVESKTSKRKN